MTPIRVLIDARKYGDGGIGRYLSWLTAGLSERTDCLLSLLVSNESAVPSDVKPQRVFLSKYHKYSFGEYFSLLKGVDVSLFDVFHAPHYTLARSRGIAAVATIHDLIHLSHPSKWFHPIVARKLIASTLRRADRVITVSNASRTALCKNFPRSESKISVIGHPPPVWNVTDSDLSDEPYLLAVISQDREHKGLYDLIQVLERVKDTIALPVVLVGYGTERLKGKKIGESIFIKGAVSETELSHLYERCSGVIVPSRIEGFGLSVLEAKVFKKRVLIRPDPALMEVVSSRDSIVSSMSISDFSKGLLEFAAECVREAKGDGIEEQRFDRGILVEATMNVYREAILANKAKR